MIKVTLDILAQIILSSLRFAQECFKVKLISKSHNRAITWSYGLAIEASYSPEYRSLLSRNALVYEHKLKQRRILTFCSVKSYFVRTSWHTHENHATTQQLCCKWLRHIPWERQLKFRWLTRREWVIRVGPEFYLILDQNDQDISFSILYDLLL